MLIVNESKTDSIQDGQHSVKELFNVHYTVADSDLELRGSIFLLALLAFLPSG